MEMNKPIRTNLNRTVVIIDMFAEKDITVLRRFEELMLPESLITIFCKSLIICATMC